MLEQLEMNFSLPEWNYDLDFTNYSDATESLKQLNKGIGTQSEAFQIRSTLFFSKAKRGQLSEVPALIEKPLDIRVISKLWLDDDFFDLCPVTDTLLKALYKLRYKLSKLVIQQLLRLFFQRFDQINDLDDLINCLQTELGRNSKLLKTSDIAKLAKNRKIIISCTGPDRIVKEAIKKEYDLEIFIEKLGLNSFIDTRFYTICQNHYYLEQLRTIKQGVWHPLLNEIIKPSVFETPYKQSEMLGHEILRILIDRSPKIGINEQWKKIILVIAGDPRTSKSTQNYQRWWTALSEQQIQKVKGWLSRIDLLLFLKVLKDYGENNGKADMKRMFPARKKFLEGLFDMGLVEDSRLFINHKAEGYLARNYKKSELPVYANVKDSSGRSMIYLKVAGKHMIEGTHNFKLWLFEALPQNCKIFDYSKSEFTDSDLRNKLERDFLEAFQEGQKTYTSITHVPDSWQHTVIEVFSDFGIHIKPEKVLTEQDYLNYKRKYGLS